MADIRLTDALLEVLQRKALDGDVQEYYVKACRGRLAVDIVDPFTGSPRTVILSGDTTDPDVELENITVALYTNHDAQFFKNTNKGIISEGLIVPYTPEFREEQLVNAVSDQELEEALDKPFFAVKALLDKFTSPIPVERLLRKARQMNKTVGVVDAIEKRLAELQEQEYAT